HHGHSLFTMKLLALLLLITSPLLQASDPAGAPGSDSLRTLLQQGFFEEEANRDLDKAAAAYEAVASRYEAQQAMAATALYRLANIRARQGHSSDAATLYNRVIAEFPKQDALTKLSREQLAKLGLAV